MKLVPAKEWSTRFYYISGKTFWFLARWMFYILLFIIAFRLGSLQGTFTQRLRQLRFPRIKLNIFPPPPKVRSFDFDIKYYTVLVGSPTSAAQAAALQRQLVEARIKSYAILDANMYFVCVGKYGSVNKAMSTLQQIRQKGFSDALVVGPRQ